MGWEGRGGAWVENAGEVKGDGGAEVSAGVAACRHVARWWPLTWESGGSSCSVKATTSCRRATCARVQTGTGSCSGVAGGRWRGSAERWAQPTKASGRGHHQRCLERVQVRDCVGHQEGHAQNVRERGAVWVQICTRTRKCFGDTFGDRRHLCRIRPRSPPGPTRHGLHGGAGGRVRAHR